eukprot:scaffold204861_cov34-Tisochrysis_lutea.AAC.1
MADGLASCRRRGIHATASPRREHPKSKGPEARKLLLARRCQPASAAAPARHHQKGRSVVKHAAATNSTEAIPRCRLPKAAHAHHLASHSQRNLSTSREFPTKFLRCPGAHPGCATAPPSTRIVSLSWWPQYSAPASDSRSRTKEFNRRQAKTYSEMRGRGASALNSGSEHTATAVGRTSRWGVSCGGICSVADVVEPP